MSKKDFYQILGVPRTASQEEIKKAHRRLARKYHPDLNPGNKQSEEMFKSIQEAYDTLSDTDKRAKYDQYGEAWHMGQAGANPGYGTGGAGTAGAGFPFPDTDPGGGINFDEFIERMFGGAGRRTGGGRSAAPAEDIAFNVEITLEEAFRGGNRRINVTVEDVCPDCEGVGQKRDARGRFDVSGNACPRCRGRGRIPSPRSGEIRIPAGAWDGLKLRLNGQGAADARGRKGDLIVQLALRTHPIFEREGQNLLFDVAIPYTIAALGGEVSVETLSGQRKQLIVPGGIQTGQRLRLTGQGMPALQDRPLGDAFARVKITVPKDLSEREKTLLTELAQIRRDPIRR